MQINLRVSQEVGSALDNRRAWTLRLNPKLYRLSRYPVLKDTCLPTSLAGEEELVRARCKAGEVPPSLWSCRYLHRGEFPPSLSLSRGRSSPFSPSSRVGMWQLRRSREYVPISDCRTPRWEPRLERFLSAARGFHESRGPSFSRRIFFRALSVSFH